MNRNKGIVRFDKEKILARDLEVSAGLGCMAMSHVYGVPADKNIMMEYVNNSISVWFQNRK